MFRGLLPREYAFYDYFEKLMSINMSVSDEFLAFVKEKKHPEVATKAIKRLEREGDKLTHDCVDLLHRTFITPIDRDQIHQLIIGLDDFADQMNAATFRMFYYNIEELRHETLDLAKIISHGITELETAVKGLRNIKKNSRSIREHCMHIHELENQADDISRIAVTELFKTNDILLILKWKEVYERLEKAVDRIERAANTIESILIDNA
jgi:predicted phosphate transport protein (TIGR00153 family)